MSIVYVEIFYIYIIMNYLIDTVFLVMGSLNFLFNIYLGAYIS